MLTDFDRLFYVHDPMCSWCWGFQKTWQEVHNSLANQIDIEYVVGGLAPDTEELMPEAQQQAIAGYWRIIQEKIPGTEFNFDFWTKCKPRRSTYPACRAVLAVKALDQNKEPKMIDAIQQAYYMHAENPSNSDTLIACAERIGISKATFKPIFQSAEIENLLQQQLSLSAQLGASGFPSLVLASHKSKQLIQIDYNNPSFIIDQVMAKLNED